MARETYADLVLTNARVLTMRRGAIESGYVAVRGDRIVGLGGIEGVKRLKGPRTREMDCQGMALLPGFNDAHCHLMALASSLRGVGCRRDKVSSIAQIAQAIRQRATETPPGRWIRAFGYDEFYLAEKRHPTRWDLDRAAPFHPVRLDHRTGHATVLNSCALELLDISRDNPDPADGIIDREEATREPTGLLFEMGGYLSRAIEVRWPHHSEQATLKGFSRVNSLLLSRGITSVQDASPGNDPKRWQTFRKLKDEGSFTPRITLMVGGLHLQSFLDLGLAPGCGDAGLRLGAVKHMLSMATGALQPPREELMEITLRAHKNGFQLAFHAVEEEAVQAAADALCYASTSSPPRRLRHRIEHCSECPPEVLEKVRSSGALVVTQPGFVYDNGEKYQSTVEEGLLPHLYPLASLARAGIALSAGSDAPVTPPDPLLSIYAAVTRKTRSGSILSPCQALSAKAALTMHTFRAAHASLEEDVKGSIAVGKLADLVLVDQDPLVVEPEGIKDIGVGMTMVGGEVVWQR